MDFIKLEPNQHSHLELQLGELLQKDTTTHEVSGLEVNWIQDYGDNVYRVCYIYERGSKDVTGTAMVKFRTVHSGIEDLTWSDQ